MKKLATYFVAGMALIGAPALAADMAVKAPRPLPQPPAPVPTWTGFYGGIQVGGGWSDEAVNYSPNDPLAALILAGFIAPPRLFLSPVSSRCQLCEFRNPV